MPSRSRHRAALVEGGFRNIPVFAGRPIGDQILISGIVGVDAEGRLPPDFRSQAENVFTTLEAILNQAGATLDDVRA